VQPWQAARPGVQVKLLPQDGERYVYAQSAERVAKERAMRRRQLKGLWVRLKQLANMALSREELLMKLGAARAHAPAAWRLVAITVAPQAATFTFRLDRNKLRQARRREGRYLLRTNLTEDDPAKLWGFYLLLVSVEEAFKTLKGDLAIRPIFHQDQARIEAHIFIAFPAYCLHATPARRLRALAPGLTPRSVIAKFAAMQMIDVTSPPPTTANCCNSRCDRISAPRCGPPPRRRSPPSSPPPAPPGSTLAAPSAENPCPAPAAL
jgi:hypothetical protein